MSQNLGFDIRSTDKDGVTRYIEVNAKAEIGNIALTQNEWFKEDYYLYVVFNTSSKLQLHIIQNPAEKLTMETKIETVRYIINSNEVSTKEGGRKMKRNASVKTLEDIITILRKNKDRASKKEEVMWT